METERKSRKVEPTPVPMGERMLLRQKDVLGCTGLSSSKLRRMVRDGEFPRPRKLGGIVVWKRSEVDDWLETI